MLPLDFDLNRTRPAERGMPYWPTPEAARSIAEDMQRLSQFWGTRLTFEESDGSIAVEGL